MELKNSEIKQQQKIGIFFCEGHLVSVCAVVSKYFLEITIRGPCKHFWGQIWAATALSGTKTVTVKLTKKAAVNLTALPLHIY